MVTLVLLFDLSAVFDLSEHLLSSILLKLVLLTDLINSIAKLAHRVVIAFLEVLRVLAALAKALHALEAVVLIDVTFVIALHCQFD